ncbi:MAG: NUDIX hydrolase [Micromonosporaceae bacterium]|nr:NUDIX hydrolase [Micromonosporaceae bacterium]
MATYDPRKYPPVAVTVDIAILTIHRGELSVLLVRRGVPPYRGLWALPGGFVRENEDLGTAAARELQEETGVGMTESPPAGPAAGADSDGGRADPGARSAGAYLEQLRTYGAPGRDPRMRTVSVAYLALVADVGEPRGGDDAADAWLWPVAGIEQGRPRLAFDHAQIIRDAVERARSKLEYTSLATSLLPEPFTIGDLRRVYEAVWGVRLHPANFRRKVLATPGFVVPTGERVSTGRGWTELYRRGTTTTLHPALLRRSQLTTEDGDEPDTL